MHEPPNTHLGCCRVCEEKAPVDVATVTQVRVVRLLRGEPEHALHQLLCARRPLEEELHNCGEELQLHLRVLLREAVEERLKELIGRFLNDPHEIYLSLDTDQTADTVNHVLYETTMEYPKPRQLLRTLLLTCVALRQV